MPNQYKVRKFQNTVLSTSQLLLTATATTTLVKSVLVSCNGKTSVSVELYIKKYGSSTTLIKRYTVTSGDESYNMLNDVLPLEDKDEIWVSSSDLDAVWLALYVESTSTTTATSIRNLPDWSDSLPSADGQIPVWDVSLGEYAPTTIEIPADLTDLGDTPSTYGAAGQVLATNSTSNGTEWITVSAGGGGAVDSVNGNTGDVVLYTDDIDEGSTNLYYTNDRVQAHLESGNVDQVNLTNNAVMTWNSIDGAVDIAYTNGVVLQVGQEEHFYAKATEAIGNGDVVMFAGAQGDHLLIAKADMSVSGFKPEWVIGVATQAFTINEFGYVTSFGKVRGLNTDAYLEGSLLWLDPDNAGQLVTSEPTPPDHVILIAAVTNSHLTQGTIFVRLSHKPDTDEIPEGSTNLFLTTAERSVLDLLNTNGLPDLPENYLWQGNSSGEAVATDRSSVLVGFATTAISSTNADKVDINIAGSAEYGIVLHQGAPGAYKDLYADSETNTPTWNTGTNLMTIANANITTNLQVGTITDVEQAIDDAEADIATLQSNVSTALSNITTLQSDVSQNSSDIASLQAIPQVAPIVNETATIVIDGDSYNNKFVVFNGAASIDIEIDNIQAWQPTVGTEIYFMSISGDVTIVSLGPNVLTPSGKNETSRGTNSVIGIKCISAGSLPTTESTWVLFGDLS